MFQRLAHLFLLSGLAAASAGLSAQTTFVVNSLGDASQEAASAGVLCFTGSSIPPQIPECTLRAALESANAADGPVVIEFWQDIPTSTGRSLIQIGTPLPFINNRVTIDGTTHPLYEGVGDTRVDIVYVGPASSSVSGLRFSSQGGASGSIVRAVAVRGFTGSGILLSGGNGYTIENNHIGVWWRPGAIAGNGNASHGIDVNGASSSGQGITLIRDNLITNNGGNGIHIRNGASATFVQGNVIGLRKMPNGGAYRPLDDWANLGVGVFIAASAGESNFIGGFGSNTISNNQGGGIVVQADGQTITGNLIGLPHDFDVGDGYEIEAYGNGGTAIVLESSGNTVGGTGIATNYIGNSPSVDIRVGNGSGSNPIAANDNQIRANYIGATPDGDAVGTTTGIRVDNGSGTVINGAVVANHNRCISLRGNSNLVTRSTVRGCIDGIRVEGGATIGGEPNLANHFHENDRGVFVLDTGNNLVTIHGNWFGTNEDGADLGNSVGIQISQPANLVDIGRPGEGNVLGHNLIGIWMVSGATETWVFSNWIGVLPNGTAVPNGRGIAINGTTEQPVRAHVVGNRLGTPYLPQQANTIAYNSLAGVDVSLILDGEQVFDNTIRGNRFFANAKGIDLGPGGDVVDPGGAADGPNRLQNFPEFEANETLYDPISGELQVRFRVRTDPDNAEYPLIINVYRADGDSAQGEAYLGTIDYTTPSAWQTVTLATLAPLQPGDFIVGTATDSAGNTSEFTSQPVPVSLTEPPPDQIFSDRFEP